MNRKLFGEIETEQGKRQVYSYEIGKSSLTARVIDYGATLQSLIYTKKDGQKIDVIGGFDSIDGYLTSTMYQGSTVGRVCNRIKKGSFTVGGTRYFTDKNDGNNTLHGGDSGFSKQIWKVSDIKDDEITFEYFSPDGESGFPGNVKVQSLYKISGNSLFITHTATTDAETPVNMTNHSYFNLEGCESTIGEHIIQMRASNTVETDDELIPTGKILPVDGTAFDLRTPVRMADVLNSDNEKIRKMNGLDTCFIFDAPDENGDVIKIYSPVSKLSLSVATDNSSIQIYTSNSTDGTVMKNNTNQQEHFGMCLETSYMPDSVNNDNFDHIILRPGEVYRHTTEYRFAERE